MRTMRGNIFLMSLQRINWSFLAILLQLTVPCSAVVINNDLRGKCYWDNASSPIGQHYVNSQKNTLFYGDNITVISNRLTKPLKETITLNNSNLDALNIAIPNTKSKNNRNGIKSVKEQCMNSYSSVMLQLIKPKEVVSECRDNATKNAQEEDGIMKTEDTQIDKDHNREWKKNYAEYDCGAKIFAASDEIKNPGDLIKKNHDEYMLTECSDNLWIVIELCENLRIDRIELDNSELYSGGPKDFSISVADKYSKNQEEWKLIGTFQAKEDKKIVQHFKIENPEFFGKYVMLNLLTNYAYEHYCTLTSFRAFGLTEYEFLSEQEEAEEKQLPEELEPEIIQSAESEAQKRLKRIADELKRTKNNTYASDKLSTASPFSPSWALTIFTYQYIMYLNHHICLASQTFQFKNNLVLSATVSNEEFINSEISTKNISDTTSENIGSIEKINEQTKDTTLDSMTTNSSKIEQTNPQIPKESVLVQISKRLKMLEKNVTLVNRLLNTLNKTNTVQSDDILHILEEVVKAQDTFQSYIQENEAITATVKNLSEKLSKFESMINEQSLTIMFLTTANIVLFTLVLTVTGFRSRTVIKKTSSLMVGELQSILKRSSTYECEICITNNKNREYTVATVDSLFNMENNSRKTIEE